MRKKSLLYLTTTRADFGIIAPLLRDLSTSVDVTLLVGGAWIDERFNANCEVLEEFKNIKIETRAKSLTIEGIIGNMGESFSTYYDAIKPLKLDAIMILGDRYEILSLAVIANLLQIPLIHLHGGEMTLGNFDECIRHMVSKCANLHLVATETYKKRVEQLGEANVYNIGALGALNAYNIAQNSKNFIKAFNRYFVVLFHPQTLGDIPPLAQLQILLRAIEKIIKELNCNFVFIGNNMDTNGDLLLQEVENFVIAHGKNTLFYGNLKNSDYLATIKNSIALIGNSSSGIIEAPSLGAITLNIGDRQRGRVAGKSVINVELKEAKIIEKIKYILENEKGLKAHKNPYFNQNALKDAKGIILRFLKNKNKNKKFIDFKF